MYSIEWIKFDRTINLPIPLIDRLYTPSLQFHDLQSSIQVNRCPMLNVIVRILPSLKTMIDQTIINSNMRHEIHTKHILQTLTEYRGMIEWTKFYLGEVDSFLTQYNIISETSHNLQFWWGWILGKRCLLLVEAARVKHHQYWTSSNIINITS